MFESKTQQSYGLGGARADLAGDVMSIEMEATDVLVDSGEGAELLDGTLCVLHHLACQALRLPWNVLNPGGLQNLSSTIRLSPNSCTHSILPGMQTRHCAADSRSTCDLE